MPNLESVPWKAYFPGFDGLTSTRLISVLAGVFNSMRTISATSSGAIFHSAFHPNPYEYWFQIRYRRFPA